MLSSTSRAICACDDPSQVVTHDGWTPPGLDVLDHQLSAARMADERPRAWVVHGIGQVPHQHHLETKLCHLAGSEAAVQDTNIGVDTHECHITDAFLLAEIVDFLTVVADAVKTDDIQGWVFTRPRIRSCLILENRIIAAARGIVDG